MLYGAHAQIISKHPLKVDCVQNIAGLTDNLLSLFFYFPMSVYVRYFFQTFIISTRALTLHYKLKKEE